MLLTKKSQSVHAHGAGSARFVQSLSRGLSNALPTMDRRAFLRRSGLGVGVGLAATQLSLVKKANAAAPGGVGLCLGLHARVELEAAALDGAEIPLGIVERVPRVAPLARQDLFLR